MRLLSKLMALTLLAAPGLAFGQLEIRLNFPAPPPLVVVSPGIQVVPDYDEEVFFTGGFYWLRRDGRWFRARDHRAAWIPVEMHAVPPGLARLPPGHYRHWKAEKAAEKAERRETREMEKADRREHRESEKRGGKHGKH